MYSQSNQGHCECFLSFNHCDVSCLHSLKITPTYIFELSVRFIRKNYDSTWSLSQGESINRLILDDNKVAG
jgi:hypothetical protein